MNWCENRPAQEAHPTRDSARPSVSEIDPQLLIGEYPRQSDIGLLKETFRVTAVLSLQDDEDLRFHGLSLAELANEYARHRIRFRRAPIPDGSAEAMRGRLRDALDELHSLIAGGFRVYLHCNAGLNRAPTLAVAYLHAHRGMSLDEALAHVKSRRACGPFMMILEDHFGPRDGKPHR